MRTKSLTLLLFFTVGLLLSCDSNDTSAKSNSINGVWYLKKVSGGLTGINIDYNQGDVKWTFTTANNTLAVENNIMTTGPEDIYAGLETGNYTYQIQVEGTIKTLFIDDQQRGIIIQLDEFLKIDDGIAADGMLTEFIR